MVYPDPRYVFGGLRKLDLGDHGLSRFRSVPPGADGYAGLLQVDVLSVGGYLSGMEVADPRCEFLACCGGGVSVVVSRCDEEGALVADALEVGEDLEDLLVFIAGVGDLQEVAGDDDEVVAGRLAFQP